MILSICDDPKTMEVINIVVRIVNILKIVVPILLLFVLAFKFTKAAVAKNEEEVKKAEKTAVPSVIAAALIFLVPTAINLIIDISFPDNEYSACFVETSVEKIEAAYVMKMEKLFNRADNSLNMGDYVAAMNYLTYIKNEKERQEYEEKLKEIKEKIDKIREQNIIASSGYLDMDFGSCKFQEKKAGGMTYAICVPENYGGQSLPMILWLHGSSERGKSFNALVGSGLPAVVRNWSSTGLKNIPAIIVAPIVTSTDDTWGSTNVLKGVKTIMDEVIANYNINTKKIALIGHSMGGAGTYYVAREYQDYFSSIVSLSSHVSSCEEKDKSYFRTIPLKGFVEEAEPTIFKNPTTNFFSELNRLDDLKYLTCDHDEVPRTVLLEDSNGDKISDIIYWMLSFGMNAISVDSDPIGDGSFNPDSGTAGTCNKHGEYKYCSPKRGIFGSFAYADSEPNGTTNRWSLKSDPAWNKENLVDLPMTCSNGWNIDMKMHKLAKSTWEKVQQALCKITTTGIDGIVYKPEDITMSGRKATSVQRFTSNTKYVSNHSYGTAIDINPGGTYTVNGKKYTPYKRNKSEYEAFVAALGREDDPRNINYILWKKIFEPLGFKWGGNWKGSFFDGMHFELDGGKK